MSELYAEEIIRRIRFPFEAEFWDTYRAQGVSELQSVNSELSKMRTTVANELISAKYRLEEGLTRRGEIYLRKRIERYTELREREAAVRSVIEFRVVNPAITPGSWESISGERNHNNEDARRSESKSFTLTELVSLIHVVEHDLERDQTQLTQIVSEYKPVTPSIPKTIPVKRKGKQAHKKIEIVTKFWQLVDKFPDREYSDLKRFLLQQINEGLPEKDQISMRTLERYIADTPRP